MYGRYRCPHATTAGAQPCELEEVVLDALASLVGDLREAGDHALDAGARLRCADAGFGIAHLSLGSEVGGRDDRARVALVGAEREAEADTVEARGEDDRAVGRGAHPLADDALWRAIRPEPQAMFSLVSGLFR